MRLVIGDQQRFRVTTIMADETTGMRWRRVSWEGQTDRQTDRVAVVKLFTNNTLIGDIEERDEVSRTRLNYIPETGHLELTRPSSWADPIKQMYNTHWTADVAVVAGYTPASVWTAVLGMLHHDHVVCRTWRVERLELTVLHRVWNNHHKHKLE